VRLVVDGLPALRGRTMNEKRTWAGRHADGLRRMLLLEPRGHAGLIAACLTEPEGAGAHAGVLFMDAGGFLDLSVHGLMAAAAIAASHGLIIPLDPGAEVRCDTAAGRLLVQLLDRTDHGGRTIAVRGVPAQAGGGGLVVDLGNRRLRADLAFSPMPFAIVDGESAGLALEPAYLPELRRIGEAVCDALARQRRPSEPAAAGLEHIAATVFTGPARGNADLRLVAVRRRSAVDRSPGGESMAAVMAILHAMGLLAAGQLFTAEGLIGTTLTGRIASDGANGIAADVEGTVWITGEHTLLAEDHDPFENGFET
jgi:proline racemase